MDAMEYLGRLVHRTPLVSSDSINRMAGKNVFLKMENKQKTGSFKLRGAAYKMSLLPDSKLRNGVIAASAGNHAQGVALAAKKRNITAKIYMPANTPAAKIESTRSYGADIVLTGNSFQEAYDAAVKEENKYGGYFLHPFDDYDVMAGQGTVAFEMLQQEPFLDTIIAPVGGGGLISGVAIAAKHINPKIKVIGVQAKGACAMYNNYHFPASAPLSEVATLAEGIAVKKPGIHSSHVINKYVDDLLVVSDQEIAAAIIFMLERQKTLIEGAGAAALAALMKYKDSIPGGHCGLIVSGGNIDFAKLVKIKELSRNTQLLSEPYKQPMYSH